MNVSKTIDRNFSRCDKYLCIRDFNTEISEAELGSHLVLKIQATLPSCIDLLLANCSRSFQDTQVIEAGLSCFQIWGSTQ